MRSPHENMGRLSCDACFMGHLGRRIRWWYSLPYLTQGQVKFGSKRWNLETPNFYCETIPCSFLSQDSKNTICFDVRQCEVPTIALQNVTSSPLPVFYHCTSKNKDIGLKFRTLVVSIPVVLYCMFRFLCYLKNGSVGIYFWEKIEVLILKGQKPKFWKSRIIIL